MIQPSPQPPKNQALQRLTTCAAKRLQALESGFQKLPAISLDLAFELLHLCLVLADYFVMSLPYVLQLLLPPPVEIGKRIAVRKRIASWWSESGTKINGGIRTSAKIQLGRYNDQRRRNT